MDSGWVLPQPYQKAGEDFRDGQKDTIGRRKIVKNDEKGVKIEKELVKNAFPIYV